MRTLLAYLTVLAAAATPWLEVLFVVPAGVVAGLPALPVVVVASVGNIATLVPVVLLGDRIRARWRRRRVGPSGDGEGHDDGFREGRLQRARQLLERFGLPGLAVLGPLLTGVHVAGLAALATGADRRRVLWWLSLGVAVWSMVLGVLAELGIEALFDRDQLPDLGL